MTPVSQTLASLQQGITHASGCSLLFISPPPPHPTGSVLVLVQLPHMQAILVLLTLGEVPSLRVLSHWRLRPQSNACFSSFSLCLPCQNKMGIVVG